METLGNMSQERILTAINYYNHILERNRANQRAYYEKNKEAVKLKSKIAYHSKYSKDPDYLAKRSQYSKKKYLLKKLKGEV
jgi:hypothetical protein